MDRTLLLLRHAKSSWEHDVEDHRRPLNERGRRDAVAVGRLLASRRAWCDLVVCSTARRARQTWDGAVLGGATTREIELTDDLYEAPVSRVRALVAGLPDAAGVVLLVGHGPGLPGLVEDLGGTVGRKYATSGLATLLVTGTWSSIGPESARLVNFVVPRG